MPADGRLEVVYDGKPAEILRDPSGLRAVALVCTHFGCRVRWNEQRAKYLCPCHGGAFDAAGHPVEGPPNQPLAVLPVELSGGEIVVGAP
jgi:cytochrome b6-f complex iron-sulfur subunit